MLGKSICLPDLSLTPAGMCMYSFVCSRLNFIYAQIHAPVKISEAELQKSLIGRVEPQRGFVAPVGLKVYWKGREKEGI